MGFVWVAISLCATAIVFLGTQQRRAQKNIEAMAKATNEQLAALYHVVSLTNARITKRERLPESRPFSGVNTELAAIKEAIHGA